MIIHFTTWDVGNRITAIDVEAARIVDGLYEKFQSELGTRQTNQPP